MLFKKQGVSLKELSVIANNLSMLYGEGLTVTTSIKILEDFPISKRYKNSLTEISKDLLNGKSLSESFSCHGEIYPEFFIEMIKSGEETGNLANVLDELGDYYLEMDNVKKEISGACVYPMFLIITMIAILGAFIFIVIPNFQGIIENSNSDIPAHTKFLIEISNYLNDNIFNVTIIFLLWFIILPYVFFKESIINYIKKQCEKIKFVKGFIEYKTIITLNMIISSGINISKGLILCSEGGLNSNFKNVSSSINKGESFSEALKTNLKLSEYTLAMIEIGEQSGTLDKSMRKVTKILKERNKNLISKMSKFIQPAVIIFMAIVVLGFVVAFILPLFDQMYNVGV